MRTRRGGFVLLTVLLTCLALWLIVAGHVLSAWLHLRTAGGTYDHAVRFALAHERVEAARASWTADIVAGGDWPAPGHVEGGESGPCTWSLTIDERDDALVRVAVEATYSGTPLRRLATFHRP